MPWTKQRSVHHLRRLDQSIRHGEQRGSVANSEKARLPTKVPHQSFSPWSPSSTITQLHDGQVRLGNDMSQPFQITNGVKQGCVLAPTLFSLFFSMMLEQATKDLHEDERAYIIFRTDGSLFNLRRLQAHTKTTEKVIRELLFADNAARVAHTERAMWRFTSCFANAADLFGLEVSLKKTEVPPPACSPRWIPSTKYFHQADQAEHCAAVLLSWERHLLAKASSAFGILHKRVWSNNNLKTETKISVYRAAVLTTLLYGSESWVLYRCHIRLLERLHQRCLRTILKIHGGPRESQDHQYWGHTSEDTTVNCHMAAATEVHPGSGTKTRWKRPSKYTTSIPTRLPRLLIAMLGATPSGRLPVHLKQAVVLAWRRREPGGKTVFEQSPAQTIHFPAATVDGSADLGSLALTRPSIASSLSKSSPTTTCIVPKGNSGVCYLPMWELLVMNKNKDVCVVMV